MLNLGSKIEFLIVGLGNPEQRYDGTRHNVGFSAIDYIAEKRRFAVKKIKFKSLIGDATINGHRCLFMKPSTYMNLSGQAVQECIKFYKIPPENIIVISDDIDLPPGTLRIRKSGSAGGHNGLKNIIYLIESDQFPRMKIGVGAKPHPDYDLADWVLARPNEEDRKAIEGAIIRINDALDLMVEHKVDLAMSKYNG